MSLNQKAAVPSTGGWQAVLSLADTAPLQSRGGTGAAEERRWQGRHIIQLSGPSFPMAEIQGILAGPSVAAQKARTVHELDTPVLSDHPNPRPHPRNPQT